MPITTGGKTVRNSSGDESLWQPENGSRRLSRLLVAITLSSVLKNLSEHSRCASGCLWESVMKYPPSLPISASGAQIIRLSFVNVWSHVSVWETTAFTAKQNYIVTNHIVTYWVLKSCFSSTKCKKLLVEWDNSPVSNAVSLFFFLGRFNINQLRHENDKWVKKIQESSWLALDTSWIADFFLPFLKKDKIFRVNMTLNGLLGQHFG